MKEDTNSSEEDKGEERRGEFIKTNGNPAKMLEAVEEAFDDITEFVNLRIIRAMI